MSERMEEIEFPENVCCVLWKDQQTREDVMIFGKVLASNKVVIVYPVVLPAHVRGEQERSVDGKRYIISRSDVTDIIPLVPVFQDQAG